MSYFCKKPDFYVSNFEIQVFVHQRHINWKDHKVDPRPHWECARTSPFPSRDKGFRDTKKEGNTTCF